MPSVTVGALAKVNFGLHILYRRPDDFHELRTVFQTISLADRMRIEYRRARARSVELTCTDAALAGPDNLAHRAAMRLLESTGSSGRVLIHLEKRIPMGAGLGGGSSDAAAALRALASMLRPGPPAMLLFRLARELGSDVPFFLVGGAAVGVGRGTEIYPLPDGPSRWMLVAAPPMPISTAEAYRRLSAQLTSGRWEDKIDRFGSRVCVCEQGPVQVLAEPENDFEPVVFRMYPELKKLKAHLKKLGARPALLCGSGSAVFGVFSDRRQALRARDSLDLEDGRSFVVKMVNRSGYSALWQKWLRETG